LEPAQRLVSDYPTMLSELRGKMSSFQDSMSEAEEAGDALAEVTQDVADLVEDPNVTEVVVRDNSFFLRAASSFAESLSTIAITLTICAFILALRQPFLVLATLPYDKISEKLHAARVLRKIEADVSHYFLVTTLINTALGTVVGLALWALDVPMPVFWGAVVGFLNYMPFVGPTIGALALLSVSVIQHDSVAMMFLPAAVYLAINFVEANFITPALIGRKTNITPLAIIVALVFWGWLWGFVGLLISVPLLVVINAAAQKIDRLSLIKRMLTPRVRH
jgi:predicted PurR-regulated permease PerM